MNKNVYKYLTFGAIALAPLTTIAGGNAPDGTFSTTTQTQIRVDVDKDTDTVILSKDDTTPSVISRAFVLKYADPYEVRPYITHASGATEIDGTDTRVEATKYSDGTGVLIVSAEDYKFEPQEDGSLSIPELIAKLDRPNFKSSSGQPKWVYYCKHRTPEDIREVTNLLFNSVKGGKTFAQGKDKTGIDTEINAVVFYLIPSNLTKLKSLIEEYDKPFDDINVTVTIYEFDYENDMSIGTDYQEWYNTIGRNMMTYDTGAGARYFNFNPEWSTDFLDFLVSKGKGKVMTTIKTTLPDLQVRTLDGQDTNSNDPAQFTGYLNLGSKITYTAFKDGKTGNNEAIKIKYDSDGDGTADRDITQAKEKVIKTVNLGLQVGMEATAYGEVNQFVYNITNTDLIGYTSDGVPRTSESQQLGEIMISGSAAKFVIGGVEKKSVVRVTNKMPFIGSIPIIGWLFNSEDEVTKKSQIVTVVDLEFENNDKGMDNEEINSKIKDVEEAEAKIGYDMYILDENKSLSEDVKDAIKKVKDDYNELINDADEESTNQAEETTEEMTE